MNQVAYHPLIQCCHLIGQAVGAKGGKELVPSLLLPCRSAAAASPRGKGSTVIFRFQYSGTTRTGSCGGTEGGEGAGFTKSPDSISIVWKESAAAAAAATSLPPPSSEGPFAINEES